MSPLLKLADPKVLAGIAGLLTLSLLAGPPLFAADTQTGPTASVQSVTVEPDSTGDDPSAAAPGCGRRGWGARGGRPGAGRGPGRIETGPGEDSMGCGCCRRRGFQSQGGQRGPGAMGQGGAMRGGGMRGGHRALMESTWTLIDGHEAIERKVEDVPGGVRTITTSTDENLVPVIRRHVREMADLIENGGRIRAWDPLFAEIFDHAEAIEIAIEDIDGGVLVTETSEDEEVAKLIRAHAVKVLEFVARGDEAYREATPLPEDYSRKGR